MNPFHTRISSGFRAPLLAVSLVAAAALAGCNRDDPPEAPAAGTSSSPSATPTAAPSSPASSSAAPATSSANTPGTPDGAAATLPSSSTPAIARSAASAETASDSKSTQPLGELTKEEESKGMPEALQAGNNHSSTALDKEAKP